MVVSKDTCARLGTTLAHDRPQKTAAQVPIEGHGAPENPVPGPGGAVYTYANDGADGASPLVSLWAPSPGRCGVASTNSL